MNQVEKYNSKTDKTHKSNSLLYFYTYVTIQIIYIVINSYLPIFFDDYLQVDRTLLAFTQIISYSALFLEPVISVYFDRKLRLKIPIRLLLILIGIGIVVSYILFLITTPLLLTPLMFVFGIFLGINLAFSSVIDVIIKKVLIKKSDSEKRKNKNVLFLQTGTFVGAFIPPTLSLFLPWNIFFISTFLITIPLISILAFSGTPEYSEDKEKLSKKSFLSDYSIKNLGLVGIFAFLIYADQLYQYPLEPFIVDLVGKFRFNLLFMIFILINSIGTILAGFISHKWDKKKILIYNTTTAGGLLILIPIVPLPLFLIFYVILMIVGGFILVNLFSLMIDISKERITIFQTIAVFITLAKVIFVPLGTWLWAFIPAEGIIFIAGVLILLSVFPLLFIKAPPKV